jgi:hypothetical protein
MWSWSATSVVAIITGDSPTTTTIFRFLGSLLSKDSIPVNTNPPEGKRPCRFSQEDLWSKELRLEVP